jgi:hypothetical protein
MANPTWIAMTLAFGGGALLALPALLVAALVRRTARSPRRPYEVDSA